MRNLLDQFRGMQLVADLGTHQTKLEWLAFHVPPGGTGQLQLEVAGTQHAAVQLKVMGLGGGSGRKFTFGAERDLGQRDQCFALGAGSTFGCGRSVAVTPTRRTTSASTSKRSSTPMSSPCSPASSASPMRARRPPRAHPAGVGWDLSSDDKGVTERLTVEFSRETELEVTLEIPGLPLAGLVPGVAMNREVRSKCEAVYTFPGRANFVGYELIGRRKDFPFWGRS